MLKLCVIDVETTGLDDRKNALVQASGKILIGGKEVSSFDFKVRPFDTDEIQDEALAVNHLTLEEIASYPTADEVVPKMKEYFYQFVDHDDPKDLLTMVGFNIKFDQGFMRSLFFKANALNSFKNIFHYKTIDVQALVLGYLFANGLDQDMMAFHQKDCARAIGIEVDEEKLHEAQEDSSLSLKIFNKMIDKLRD
jgi:DNA polymerase III alpha subunit (gram-positive type)